MPASAAFTRSNRQGSPSAPRPIMTPSQPVAVSNSTAPSAVVTSPLAKTGIETARLISAIAAGSIGGMYICSRVRPCTTSRSAPFSSQALATAGPVRWSASQPMRILTVSGRSPPRASRAALTIAPQRAGSSSSLLPAPPPVILGAGHPMFISRISNRSPFSSRISTARPIVSGSLPNSCTAYTPWGSRSRSRSTLLWSPKVIALALAISLTVQAAPWSAIRRRQAASLKPAIGANAAPAGTVRFRSCIYFPYLPLYN